MIEISQSSTALGEDALHRLADQIRRLVGEDNHRHRARRHTGLLPPKRP